MRAAIAPDGRDEAGDVEAFGDDAAAEDGSVAGGEADEWGGGVEADDEAARPRVADHGDVLAEQPGDDRDTALVDDLRRLADLGGSPLGTREATVQHREVRR